MTHATETVNGAARPTLVMAMDLGRGQWRLGFAIGAGQRPRSRTIRGDEWRRLGDEIAAAKAKFGLPTGRKWLDIPGAIGDATALAIQPDGKIIVVGSAETDDTGYNFAVARLIQNGLNDTTFSGNGVLMTDLGGTDLAYAVGGQRIRQGPR